MKYEHFTRKLSPEHLHTQVEFDMLNEMGEAGWQISMISQDANYFYYYFTREKKEGDQPTNFK